MVGALLEPSWSHARWAWVLPWRVQCLVDLVQVQGLMFSQRVDKAPPYTHINARTCMHTHTDIILMTQEIRNVIKIVPYPRTFPRLAT